MLTLGESLTQDEIDEMIREADLGAKYLGLFSSRFERKNIYINVALPKIASSNPFLLEPYGDLWFLCTAQCTRRGGHASI